MREYDQVEQRSFVLTVWMKSNNSKKTDNNVSRHLNDRTQWGYDMNLSLDLPCAELQAGEQHSRPQTITRKDANPALTKT